MRFLLRASSQSVGWKESLRDTTFVFFSARQSVRVMGRVRNKSIGVRRSNNVTEHGNRLSEGTKSVVAIVYWKRVERLVEELNDAVKHTSKLRYTGKQSSFIHSRHRLDFVPTIFSPRVLMISNP